MTCDTLASGTEEIQKCLEDFKLTPGLEDWFVLFIPSTL